MKDISITIVAYHGTEDVKNAVHSIEKHTSQNIQKVIYIVDNGEKEDGQLQELQSIYDDVEYVFAGKNLGFGGGHNLVLNRLDSKYHAIVNPDILLETDAFSDLIAFMKNDTIGMCVPRLYDENHELLSVYRRDLTVFDMFIRMFLKKGFRKRQAYHTMQDMNYEAEFDVPFAQGSFLLIRTELFREIGGFDERFFLYMEDADLCKRVREKARLVYCPSASVIHKWERGSHKNKKLFQLHLKSMFAYFSKWGWKLV